MLRLDWIRSVLNRLYNSALEERKNAWEKDRKSVSLYDQMKGLTRKRKADPEGLGALPSRPKRECCFGWTGLIRRSFVHPAIYFFDPQGTLMDPETVMDITGDLEVEEDGALTVATAIPSLGELTLSTHGRGGLTTGSVQVFADGPAGGVLRFDLPSVGVAGVGAGVPVRDAVFPARRQTDGINTGAAIRNLEERTVTVICLLMKNGRRLDGARIILEPNGQMASFIDEPELFGEWFNEAGASDFTGSIHCATFGGGTFTGVALEMDPGNRIFTTLPVIQK